MHRETARRAMSVEILWAAAQLYEKSNFKKACSITMTLKITYGHRNYLYSIGHRLYRLLIVVCSNNECILRPFRCIATFTVYAYVTACDLGCVLFLETGLLQSETR